MEKLATGGRARLRIHAYQITARGDLSLDQVLTHISQLPLEQRLRDVAGSEIRLEAANKAGQVWSLDFGGIHQEGPGRAARDAPIIDFDLNADEGFGEETAAVFNGGTGFMALQYNHHGPRSGRIQSYLFRFARYVAGLAEDVPNDDDHGFTLLPVIRQDTIERLNRSSIIKKLRMSVFVPGLAHIEQPQRQSLSGILDTPVVGSAANLNFEISAGRKRRDSLNIDAVRRMVQEALGFGDDIHALEAVIRETEDAPSEPLDLLEARLQSNVRVDLTGRRYARNERWAALSGALNDWAAEGRLGFSP
jgi:hypothetical protein